MIDENNLSEVVKISPDTHMVSKGIAPMREFLLGESKTGTSKNELIVIVIVTLAVHKHNNIV